MSGAFGSEARLARHRSAGSWDLFSRADGASRGPRQRGWSVRDIEAQLLLQDICAAHAEFGIDFLERQRVTIRGHSGRDLTAPCKKSYNMQRCCRLPS